MEKDHAILIRRSRLTETSLIIHWCAPEIGIVKTVAKGARNPKSKFHGNLDLFYQAEIEIVRSRTSDLHILKDLSVTDPRFGIRNTYPRTLAAAYFVTLLETVCERETPIGEFFDLLKRALDYLAKDDPDWNAVLHFEKEIARILGLPLVPLSPIQAIRDLYHRIPAQRAELQHLLHSPPPPGGPA